MHLVFCWGQFHPNSSIVVRPISYPHIWPLCGRKTSTYKFYYAQSAMMHTRGTRRMFLKIEQRPSLEKLGVMPMQRNCCIGYLLRWWIHQMPLCSGLSADCLSMQGMNGLSAGWWIHPSRVPVHLWHECTVFRRGMGSSLLEQPPPLSPGLA